ncbi:hypothetical protein B0H14DRAFT_3785266 [Mycena olivaceomarginata]|nr:hypothetical protein B0H14DRAFT_3785266 [Mycena olivaceomarginata]
MTCSDQEDLVMQDAKALDAKRCVRRNRRKRRMNFGKKGSRIQVLGHSDFQTLETLHELSPTLEVSCPSAENQHDNIIYRWDTNSEQIEIRTIPAYIRTTSRVDLHAIPWPMIPFPQTKEIFDGTLNMDPDGFEASEKLKKYIENLAPSTEARDMELVRHLYIAFHPDVWSRVHTCPGLIKLINLISMEVGGVYQRQKSAVSNLPPVVPEDTTDESEETRNTPYVNPDTFRRPAPHSYLPRKSSTQFPAQPAAGKKGRIFKPCKDGTDSAISWETLTQPRIGKLDPEAKFHEVPIGHKGKMGRGRT